MFVYGPQVIKQRSDNSEDGSDEEGPEDVLQVNPLWQNLFDISACFVQMIFWIIEENYYKLLIVIPVHQQLVRNTNV